MAKNRVKAVATLLAENDCDIVIADDGLQHYRLARDIEIAIIDQTRGLGNGFLLPAGPLREPPSRLKKVDLVINHGASGDMRLVEQAFIQLIAPTVKWETVSHETTWHAVTAIGNPKRFFDLLRRTGLTIKEHIFPDHYLYQAADFDFGDELPIMITEKDAVKCESFADERFWCVSVEAVLKPAVEGILWNKIQRVRGKLHA